MQHWLRGGLNRLPGVAHHGAMVRHALGKRPGQADTWSRSTARHHLSSNSCRALAYSPMATCGSRPKVLDSTCAAAEEQRGQNFGASESLSTGGGGCRVEINWTVLPSARTFRPHQAGKQAL